VSSPDRAEIWRRLGEPHEQLGSVNDPRTSREVELGRVRVPGPEREWNEKWVYRDRDGRTERIVLWNRYDLVGIFRVTSDGELEQEAHLDVACGNG
jgi:hypothetical protein